MVRNVLDLILIIRQDIHNGYSIFSPICMLNRRMVLSTGFFYAATDIDASWLQTESLQRVDAKELSRDDFLERFETQPTKRFKRGREV